MTVQESINRAQQEIIALGLALCDQLSGSLKSTDIADVREYFEHNEYGEAMHLLAHIEGEDEITFSAKATELRYKIVDRMNLVRDLYCALPKNEAVTSQE